MTTDGDIIVAIGDVSVQDMDDLIVYLADKSVGERVTLTVLRDGAKRKGHTGGAAGRRVRARERQPVAKT
jgi:C-terminal processing protease CtpA/Prc